jgi:general secretion pathway protein B
VAFAVSGIAWNKDSADRLAIVNGQPLTTGSAIAGALVEEILPDRVRFSQEGKTFEVHLGNAGKTH